MGATKDELETRVENAQLMWEVTRDKPDLLAVDPETLNYLTRHAYRNQVVNWAERVKDEYWAGVEAKRKERDRGATYGIRIIEQQWTVTCQWFLTFKLPTVDKVRYKSLSLPQRQNGVSMRMRKNQFPKAKDWELELIMQAEDQFQAIRETCEAIKAVTHASMSLTHKMTRVPEDLAD